MVRSAVVAGQFYPGQKVELQKSLQSLIPAKSESKPTIAVMSPHAGYMYSGTIAGKTFAAADVPDDILILGPNHTGKGQMVSVYDSGLWETPLGKTEIAAALAGQILQECSLTASDTVAHQFEHSLEVQLPFLQYLNPDVRIVPICISRMPLDKLLELGEGLAHVISKCAVQPLIVASTDMTHFEPGTSAREKDFKALDRVLALDPEGLYDVVMKNRISMCGVMPTVAMLTAAKALGASKAELIGYSNSGDVTGDQSEVVAYAGVRVF